MAARLRPVLGAGEDKTYDEVRQRRLNFTKTVNRAFWWLRNLCEEYMKEEWTSFFDTLNKIPWERIVRFIKLLTVQQPFALLLVLSLLAASLYLGKMYWYRFTTYEQIVRDTLKADLVETPQSFKGLEAFILSKVERGVIDDLKKKHFDDGFIKNCIELRDKTNEFLNIDPTKYKNSKLLVAPGKNDGKILTDDHENGFLFLPVYILRSTLSKRDFKQLLAFNEKRDKSEDDILNENKFLAQKTSNETNLRRDIALTRHLANTLQKFTNIYIPKEEDEKNFEISPAQVYMITKNGINRIFNNKDPKPSHYYGSQFPATTFFPSRPYFWPTFKDDRLRDISALVPNQQETLGEYFHITRPYMDLGGNGIVITLTHGLQIDGITQAAICFDLRFKDEDFVHNILEDRINAFHGKRVVAKFEIAEAGDIISDLSDKRNPDNLDTTQTALVQKMKDFIVRSRNRGELSEVFGNIKVINPSDTRGAKPELLQISVPSDRASYEGNSRTGTFLLFTLNLAEYKRKISYIALGASSAFGIMTLLLGYLWWLTSRHRQEYEEAFKRVASVMIESPTPYVRLDAQDRICDLSLSFCAMLEYLTNEDSIVELKTRTVRSFCADKRSEETYDSVQEKRKKRQKVEPYQLTLRTRKGLVVSVWVVSADIPSGKPGKLPETFGIFLDKPPVRVINSSEFQSDKWDDEGKVIPMREVKR